MTTRKYSSRSQQTTLSAALTSTATTATVLSGSNLMGGATIAAGETFTVVIDPDTALEEIVDVTAISTNTLTIVRGIENAGTGQAHSAGAVVRHMVTGRDLREANEHIENTTTAHGLTLANVVKTTDTGTVSSGMLATGAVGTVKIDDTAVTEAKLAPSAVSTAKIADSAVTSAKIADGTIVNADINSAAAIAATKISGTAVTQADTGTVATAMIADNAVTSAKIADGTIVNADINASAAIDKTKISGTAITAGDTGTVTSTMIADGTIVNGDISASAAIDKTKISGTAITAGDTGTVTSTMIADGTIVNGDVSSSAAIAYSKLNLTGGIVNADIASGAAIALSKLATDPLARANHTGTQTASTISDFNTAVRTNRLDQMAAPTASVSLNSQKITNLAAPTASGDASTKDYVDTSIANLIAGAPSTLDTLDEIAAALNDTANFSDTVVLKTGSTMSGALNMGTNKITNLGTPTVSTDAATKGYIDTAVIAPANLTGPITSVGNVTSIASQTGTGTKFVVDTSPTIVTPTLSSPAFSGQVSTDVELAAGRSLIFEGATDDAYETTLTVTDPTADRTVTIPDATTTLVGTDTNQTLTNKTINASNNTITNVSLSTSVTGTLPITNGGTGQTTANAALNALLPSQTSNANKYLKTDGTNTSWTTVDALPSQTGNSGKYLTTNGTSASWAAIVTDPTPSIFMLMGA